MSENTNFMNFENLNKLIEEHRKETIPYKNYEFDNTSYTLLLININNLLKENQKSKDQQKEFIEYMNKTIEELQCDDVDDEEMKGYLIQRIDTFKEILQKYKSIIGVSDDKTN